MLRKQERVGKSFKHDLNKMLAYGLRGGAECVSCVNERLARCNDREIKLYFRVLHSVSRKARN